MTKTMRDNFFLSTLSLPKHIFCIPFDLERPLLNVELFKNLNYLNFSDRNSAPYVVSSMM